MIATNTGFWGIPHKDVKAIHALHLPGELMRVYQSVADLTRGYGKAKDIISLGQISEMACTDNRHTYRALKKLSQLGLYRESRISTRKILRWVVWPPPAGSSRKAPVSAMGGVNRDNATAGVNSKNPVSARAGVKDNALGGAHQYKKVKEEEGHRPSSAPSDHKQFMEFFCTEYHGALGRKYIVTGAKDGNLVKALLGKLSLDELKLATRNMLADAWGQSRASIGLLSSQINTWLNDTSDPSKGETPEQQAERGFLSQFPPMRVPTPEEAEELLRA